MSRDRRILAVVDTLRRVAEVADEQAQTPEMATAIEHHARTLVDALEDRMHDEDYDVPHTDDCDGWRRDGARETRCDGGCMPTKSEIMSAYAVCQGCGRTYTAEAWSRLPAWLLGVRGCRCHRPIQPTEWMP